VVDRRWVGGSVGEWVGSWVGGCRGMSHHERALFRSRTGRPRRKYNRLAQALRHAHARALTGRQGASHAHTHARMHTHAHTQSLTHTSRATPRRHARTRAHTRTGFTEVASQLLFAGADANAKSSTGVTALLQATQSGRPRIVREILETGIDVDINYGECVCARACVCVCARMCVLRECT
jgi:hypothetical protein